MTKEQIETGDTLQCLQTIRSKTQADLRKGDVVRVLCVYRTREGKQDVTVQCRDQRPVAVTVEPGYFARHA